jgi:hypothetical protein
MVEESTRDGDPCPAGDIGLEPGGDSVDAYRDAADGWFRLNAMVVSESDMERGSPVSECAMLGSLMAAAEAGAGSAWIGSVGGASSLRGCVMNAACS